MEFIVRKDEIVKAIFIVSKAITGRTTKPILDGIYISVEKNKVVFRGSDLDITIETSINTQIIKEGSLVINAATFFDVVKKITDNVIHITQESDKLVLKAGNTEVSMLILKSENYPQLPKFKNTFSISLNKITLKDMIKETIFATSTEDTKSMLQCVLMELEEKELRLVASDGLRLAMRKTKVNEENKNKISVLINAKNLNNIYKLFYDNNDIFVKFSENHILFEFETTKIFLRLQDENYFDYKGLMPKSINTILKVKKESLENAVERAVSLGKPDKVNYIKLESNKMDNKLKIISQSSIGKAIDNIDTRLKGEDINITFNSKFILDSLKNIKDDVIILRFNNSTSPIIIKGDEYLYFVVPARDKS